MIVNTSNANFVITPNFTLPVGLKRFVLFMLAGVGDAYSNWPESVDIAGTAATMITGTEPTNEAAQIWGANIPDNVAAGSYTITTSGTTFQRYFIAVFTGVSGDPVVNSASAYGNVATGDGSSLTVDCAGGGWVHDIIYATPAKTAGANQSVIYNTTGRPGVSYKSGLAHGTTSMAWTWTDSRFAHAVVSLRPYRPTGGVVIF